jgi:uncharacterized SAM-binding protein YcdF (DUF218 family)
VFLYLSKILPLLLDPFLLTLLLLAGIVLWPRLRKRAWIAALAAFLLLAVPGSPIVSDFLASSLEHQFPDHGIESLPPAQVIVVLGGSIASPSGAHSSSRLVDSSDRLLVALRLYHAGKAPLILCSGGDVRLFGQAARPPEAQVMSDMLQEWDVPKDAILIEGGSENTRQNATMSYEKLAPRGIRKILLVTSAMHMPRASAVFRKAGFEVIPAPADFRTGWQRDVLGLLPNGESLGHSQQAVHEWLGLWIYHLRGWA